MTRSIRRVVVASAIFAFLVVAVALAQADPQNLNRDLPLMFEDTTPIERGKTDVQVSARFERTDDNEAISVLLDAFSVTYINDTAHVPAYTVVCNTFGDCVRVELVDDPYTPLPGLPGHTALRWVLTPQPNAWHPEVQL